MSTTMPQFREENTQYELVRNQKFHSKLCGYYLDFFLIQEITPNDLSKFICHIKKLRSDKIGKK